MKNLKVCIASSALVAALALAPASALAEGTTPASTSTTGVTAIAATPTREQLMDPTVNPNLTPDPEPAPAPEPEPAPAPAPTPAKKSVFPATGIADVVAPVSVLAVSGLGFVTASRKVCK